METRPLGPLAIASRARAEALRAGAAVTEIADRDDLAELALRIEEQPNAVVPYTGEAIDLRDPAAIAGGLERIRDLKRQLDEIRSLLEDVLRLESQRRGTKTLHLADGLDAVVYGGSKTEWDIEQLGEALRAAGLPGERFDELVKVMVSYRVDSRVAKQLEAANPAYAKAIASARQIVPDKWRVSLKRR
jgi:hypothetical protein